MEEEVGYGKQDIKISENMEREREFGKGRGRSNVAVA